MCIQRHPSLEQQAGDTRFILREDLVDHPGRLGTFTAVYAIEAARAAASPPASRSAMILLQDRKRRVGPSKPDIVVASASASAGSFDSSAAFFQYGSALSQIFVLTR